MPWTHYTNKDDECVRLTGCLHRSTTWKTIDRLIHQITNSLALIHYFLYQLSKVAINLSLQYNVYRYFINIDCRINLKKMARKWPDGFIINE